MASHNGRNGVIKIGGTALTRFRSWRLNTTTDTTDLTAGGDTFRTHAATYTDWSVTGSVLLDHADAAQVLVDGATVALELYSEGEASGSVYFAGNAIVTGVGTDVGHDAAVTREITLQGTGALTRETVA